METIEEQAKYEMSTSTSPSPVNQRICLVGDVNTDTATVRAAYLFDVPVIQSETGLDIINDYDWRTFFIVSKFEGPVYEALHKTKQSFCSIMGPPALRHLARSEGGLIANARPIYNYAMSGVVTCFTGIRKKDELTKLVHLIHSMGGCIRKDMNSKITHLISTHSGGDKYQYAKTFRLTVVRPEWVYAAWNRRDEMEFSATSDDFSKDHKLKAFEGQKICFFGFPADEHQHMMDVLKSNGGVPAELDDPECSHVVMPNSGGYFLESITNPSLQSPKTLSTSTTNSQFPQCTNAREAMEVDTEMGATAVAATAVLNVGDEAMTMMMMAASGGMVGGVDDASKAHDDDGEDDDLKERLMVDFVDDAIEDDAEAHDADDVDDAVVRAPRRRAVSPMSDDFDTDASHEDARNNALNANASTPKSSKNALNGCEATLEVDGIVLDCDDESNFQHTRTISPILSTATAQRADEKLAVSPSITTTTAISGARTAPVAAPVLALQGVERGHVFDLANAMETDDLNDVVLAAVDDDGDADAGDNDDDVERQSPPNAEQNDLKRKRESFDSVSLVSVDSFAMPTSTKKPKLIRAGSITRSIKRSMSFVAVRTPIAKMLRPRRSSVAFDAAPNDNDAVAASNDADDSICSITSVESTFNESIRKPVREKLRSIRERITRSSSKKDKYTIHAINASAPTSTPEKADHPDCNQTAASASGSVSTASTATTALTTANADFKTPKAPSKFSIASAAARAATPKTPRVSAGAGATKSQPAPPSSRQQYLNCSSTHMNNTGQGSWAPFAFASASAAPSDPCTSNTAVALATNPLTPSTTTTTTNNKINSNCNTSFSSSTSTLMLTAIANAATITSSTDAAVVPTFSTSHLPMPTGGGNIQEHTKNVVLRSTDTTQTAAANSCGTAHTAAGARAGIGGGGTGVGAVAVTGHSMQFEEDSNVQHAGAGRCVTVNTVVDEHTTQTKPEPKNNRTHILKSDWFWYTIQNGFADEMDYLFGDYLDSIANTPNTDRRDSLPISFNKRKRKRFSQRLQLEGTPLGSGKRRSSVSDAGLLSVSSSFFDCTTSPEKLDSVKLLTDVETPSAELTPAKKSMRFNHFMDFFSTESNYVGILDTIVNLFKNPLEEISETGDALLNRSEIKSIFNNFLPIHEVHRSMLECLRALNGKWAEDCSIGDIILEHRDELMKAYPPYVNYFEQMKETLLQCDAQNPRFHAFLKINQTKPECGRQSLQDLMIRPVQRLPSISLLLNDILKHTHKSNPDYARLENALKAIKEVMMHINEDKRKTESRVAIFDIFNDIEGCPADLVSSNRSFITKCEVTELSDNLSGRGDALMLYLFSDTIEVCKKRSRGFNTAKSPGTTKTHKHIKLMSLNAIRFVIDITDSPRAFALLCRQDKDKLHSFTISDEEIDKVVYLKLLCKQMAENACRTDTDKALLCRTSQELEVDISDVNLSALSKAFKLAARTRLKVGRAFSFNKTPSKLKRAVSTMITSPFGSTNSLTPASQLAQMRLASCTNINEVVDEERGRSSTPSTQSEVLLPCIGARKNKSSTLAVGRI